MDELIRRNKYEDLDLEEGKKVKNEKNQWKIWWKIDNSLLFEAIFTELS